MKNSSDLLISIIVPIYNIEDYLERCIDSIVRQTYKNIEIILVDDGSIDHSSIICDNFANNDSRVQVIHKENGGLVSARKAGIMAAKGDYIMNVDGDDWIELDACEILIDIVRIYQPDVISFGFKKDYSDFSIERSDILNEGFYTKEKLIEQTVKCVRENGFFCPVVGIPICSKLFKREKLKKYQLGVDNRIRIGEDAAVTFPYIFDSDSLYVEKSCLYHYCVRKSSIMWNKSGDKFERYLEFVKVMKKVWGDLEGRKKEIEDYYIYILYFQLILNAPEYCFKKRGACLLFPEIKKNDSIILYGKGVFATNLINIFRITKFCNVIDCVDRNDISRLRNLDENSYKYVVIAITDYSSVKSTLMLLKKMGVKENKVVYIKKENLIMENLPKKVVDILNDVSV